MKAIHLAVWRRPAWHARSESPELSGRYESSPIRKLAQCRQMYCVIYSCSLACPSADSGRHLTSVSRCTMVLLRAVEVKCCPAINRFGRPVLALYQASISNAQFFFSLGTGQTDFFLSSVHRLDSVCILRLCMHPVTSPVTACAGHSSRR